MNKIKVSRLLLSAFVTLVIAIGLDFLVEGIIASQLAVGNLVAEWNLTWIPSLKPWHWAVSILISAVNCIWIMWLYAALRPMFGVGIKTALLTSAFALVFIASFVTDVTNIGLFPTHIAVIELVYELIELPIAVIAGARVYETG